MECVKFAFFCKKQEELGCVKRGVTYYDAALPAFVLVLLLKGVITQGIYESDKNVASGGYFVAIL